MTLPNAGSLSLLFAIRSLLRHGNTKKSSVMRTARYTTSFSPAHKRSHVAPWYPRNLSLLPLSLIPHSCNLGTSRRRRRSRIAPQCHLIRRKRKVSRRQQWSRSYPFSRVGATRTTQMEDVKRGSQYQARFVPYCAHLAS